MFSKVLVANRGEIAVRVMRTLRELGIASVALNSDVDARARHVRAADESVHLPGTAATDTYMHVEAILAAAKATGAQAVHPGYGFLAENADFASAVTEAGLTWIGPPPEATRAVGDKIRARALARAAGVPVVPGLFNPAAGPEEIEGFARAHGYPVAIKAAGGGGGRGFRVAHGAEEVPAAWEAARREAQAYFGSADVYAERYLEAPKHLEVQIMAAGPDEAIWLGIRDCSLQRRHQKLVEETPPPGRVRSAEMGEAAVALAKACGYMGAGTVEMLTEPDGTFYFLEMNARLQVEHTVTEEVFGVDLVAAQLAVAAGEGLTFTQSGLAPRGHAIECRINAEDPSRGFAPSPGRLEVFVPPGGPGVRVDSGYASGDEVPEAYDSLIAKVISWAPSREAARRRMLRALRETEIEGVVTTIPLLANLLESDAFRSGTHTTRTVENEVPIEPGPGPDAEPRAGLLLVGGRAVLLWNPAMARSGAASTDASPGGGEVLAPMQGTVLATLVAAGDRVEAGAPLVVLEAMKMETTLVAPIAGEIQELSVRPGDPVASGHLLARIA